MAIVVTYFAQRYVVSYIILGAIIGGSWWLLVVVNGVHWYTFSHWWLVMAVIVAIGTVWSCADLVVIDRPTG